MGGLQDCRSVSIHPWAVHLSASHLSSCKQACSSHRISTANVENRPRLSAEQIAKSAEGIAKYLEGTFLAAHRIAACRVVRKTFVAMLACEVCCATLYGGGAGAAPRRADTFPEASVLGRLMPHCLHSTNQEAFLSKASEVTNRPHPSKACVCAVVRRQQLWCAARQIG